MITSLSDLKLYLINMSTLLVSFSNAEVALKIVLLIMSIAYTTERWIAAMVERRNKKNKK